MFPVIQPGATKIVIVHAKTERPHEPQLGSNCNAGAANTARVVWYLRLVKHHVQERCVGNRHSDLRGADKRLIMLSHSIRILRPEDLTQRREATWFVV